MIIVIDVVIILLTIGCFVLDDIVNSSRGRWEDASIRWFVTGVIFSICAFFAFIATICLGVSCTELHTYDSQISIIEEQNTAIENEITTIVLSYEEYEKETFVSAKINSDDLDFIAVAEMYPDLKSNELVKSQIEIYKANNEKLTELKLEKAKGSISQWWLYFKPFN